MVPGGVAVNKEGNVYVTDGNHRIQKFTSDGTFIIKWGSSVQVTDSFRRLQALRLEMNHHPLQLRQNQPPLL